MMNFLRMMDESMKIMLVDCILGFTDVITNGNVNDGNRGNTPDLEFSRWFCGVLYISLFMLAICVHSLHLLYLQVSHCKREAKKKQVSVQYGISQERKFQKLLRNITQRIDEKYRTVNEQESL